MRTSPQYPWLAFTVSVAIFLMPGCCCLFPSPQSMPASNIECLILDATTGEPIEGAELFMVYRGPTGTTLRRGPFVTDEAGVGYLKMKKEWLWLSGPERYCAGGYLRHIEIQADGYLPREWHENFDYRRLDRESPLTFKMKHNKAEQGH